MKRSFLIQFWILFAILLANFIAQVFYFFRLYYTPRQPFPDLRSALLMGTIFAVFLVSYWLFLRRSWVGFYALMVYLLVEFLFYFWNILSGWLHGYGWFFHLSEQDPVLWAVFAIGYLSFFASGYFIFLLLYNSHGARTK